jgi:hypothetical protein
MRSEHRARARAELAIELDRLAARFDRFAALDVDSDLYDGDPELRRDLDGLSRDLNRAVRLAREFRGRFGRDLARELYQAPEGARDLPDLQRRWASVLQRRASVLGAHQTVGRPYGDNQVEGWVLDCLARSLPTGERVRFVAEARGNLGDCEHWWQRVEILVCLALATPRLAWMMWRDGRRGRAE